MRGRTALQIKRYARSFVILLGLIAIGSTAGFYILLQQRLPNPFQSFFSVNAAFPSAAAVVPGLGEPVNVAGVHVGEITGVTLKNGRGVLHMQIDPGKLPGRDLYRDAQADLVPNTPLMDMQVNINPGDPSTGKLPHGATIPVGQTTVPVSSDDLLSALDTDTRTWLATLIAELDNGTRGRGQDLRALLMNLAPTSRQLRQIGDLLANRRTELASLVHNLGVLTTAASEKDAQIRTVVRAGDATIGAIASQNAALRDAITRLPGTLATTRNTLADLTSFSDQLGPTATALIPTVHHLPQTLRGTQTLLRGAALLPLNQVPKFEAAILPLSRYLGGISGGLSKAVPALTSSFKVLDYITNELGYDPGGKNPGFLYWFAWFAHNADSFLSTSDANGPTWRGLLLTTCPSLSTFSFGPLLKTLLGTTFGC
jgi:phospholipid/cholesterol/gamma-HCH transport system substrate-binding protein